MKIIYIANSRIPTEKAHGLQIMKMCEAFCNLGEAVELIIPNRKNPLKNDSFEFYNIKSRFKVKKIWTADLLPFEKFLGKIAFLIQNTTFALSGLLYTSLNQSDYIFTRDLISAMLLSALGKKVCFEIHDSAPINFLTKTFFNKISVIVSTNNYKKEEIIGNFGTNGSKILVAPNGVDLSLFDIKKSKEECRKILGLPLDKNIILYAGQRYQWKGVNILEQARPLLESIGNYLVQIITDKAYKQVPFWLRAADVLILPNSKKVNEMQSKATSPIKLFEYMASGTPIVASDIPAIREIVGDAEVFFTESDSLEKLVDSIVAVLKDTENSRKRANLAKNKVKEYTWDKRAEEIVKFLSR